MNDMTLIIPYYRAPLMLREQLKVIADYPVGLRVVVVDDCSPEPAEDYMQLQDGVSLYRIDTDIPWNREGARNLGAHVAETEWITQIDIDHILPPECAERLLSHKLTDGWYRFPRFRVGRADDTRKKDVIPDDCEYGEIKPHIDSYLCKRDLYWKAGGYNEDYSGFLGGGGQFLKLMKLVAGEPSLLPKGIYLEVYTRHVIADASVSDLSRDKTAFRKKKREIGLVRAENPLRFKWHKVQ